MPKSKLKTIIAVAVLLVLVIGAFAAWKLLGPQPRDRHPEQTAAVTAAPEKEEAPAEEPAPAPEENNEAEPPAEPEAEEAPVEPEAEEAPTELEAEDAAELESEETAAPAESNEDLVTIGVSVTHKDGSVAEFSITTAGLTLREAMEQEALIAGEDSEWGLYVLTVDGETVNEEEQEWWCINSNDEMLMTGVDSTYIADGDHYEFVFTVGW